MHKECIPIGYHVSEGWQMNLSFPHAALLGVYDNVGLKYNPITRIHLIGLGRLANTNKVGEEWGFLSHLSHGQRSDQWLLMNRYLKP